MVDEMQWSGRWMCRTHDRTEAWGETIPPSDHVCRVELETGDGGLCDWTPLVFQPPPEPEPEEWDAEVVHAARVAIADMDEQSPFGSPTWTEDDARVMLDAMKAEGLAVLPQSDVDEWEHQVDTCDAEALRVRVDELETELESISSAALDRLRHGVDLPFEATALDLVRIALDKLSDPLALLSGGGDADDREASEPTNGGVRTSPPPSFDTCDCGAGSPAHCWCSKIAAAERAFGLKSPDVKPDAQSLNSAPDNTTSVEDWPTDEARDRVATWLKLEHATLAKSIVEGILKAAGPPPESPAADASWRSIVDHATERAEKAEQRALVWQCGRCGATDPGSDDQREGRQPPSGWLHIYRPSWDNAGARRTAQDTICDACVGALSDWFEGGVT